LALGAIGVGVVYGDIGTSPLYALRTWPLPATCAWPRRTRWRFGPHKVSRLPNTLFDGKPVAIIGMSHAQVGTARQQYHL